jgi:hypothetical protein
MNRQEEKIIDALASGFMQELDCIAAMDVQRRDDIERVADALEETITFFDRSVFYEKAGFHEKVDDSE